MVLPVPCSEGTTPHLAGHIQDRWFKTETDSAGKSVRVQSDRHGSGPRYRARDVGPDGTEKSKSFPDGKKRLAEKWLSAVGTDTTRGRTPTGRSRPTGGPVIHGRPLNCPSVQVRAMPP